MTDLTSLRPADNSPAAIAAALDRCNLAARGAAAELGRLKANRAGLLMAGHPSQIDANAAELARAAADGQAVLDLTEQLTTLLTSARPAQSAEETARAAAFAAVDTMTRWWQLHGPELVAGMQATANAAIALANWQAVTVAPPSNVVPIVAPRPPGAA